MSILGDLKKIVDMRPRDVLSVFPMSVALLLRPIARRKYAGVWAICERHDEARDNGYHFFRYMTQEHAEQPCVYFIDTDSPDYERVACLGRTEKFGSIKHWMAYFGCEYLVSSQTCKPNAFLCTFIERAGLFRAPHVFLQHGITINRPPYLMASKRPMKYFLTATPQETKDIEANFGYPEGTVHMTGFPRFDALHAKGMMKRNRILIMPTWRTWLRQRSEYQKNERGPIEESEYVSAWSGLVHDSRFKAILERYQLEAVLFLHQNMREVLDVHALESSAIKCAEEGEDLQKLMLSSSMMITDYSSAFFDMAYMQKPVIFYQFDEEKYRERHYPEGWFDYHATSFGVWCNDIEGVTSNLEELASRGFEASDASLKEHAETFPLYDERNSERVFRLLVESKS